MAVLSLNDYQQAAYGQDAVAVQNLKVGAVIGGRFQGTPGTIANGQFGIANVSETGNLMVDVQGGEIIASLGTVDVVKAGSIVVTAGTITTGSIVAMTTVGEYIGTITITTPGSAGTLAMGTTGLMRNITIITPNLEGTGTATVLIKDSKGGTVFSQAQNESLTTNYGSIVPLATTMTIQAHADGTQSATGSVVFSIHHER